MVYELERFQWLKMRETTCDSGHGGEVEGREGGGNAVSNVWMEAVAPAQLPGCCRNSCVSLDASRYPWSLIALSVNTCMVVRGNP